MDLREVLNVPKFTLKIFGLWPDTQKTIFAKIRGSAAFLLNFAFCALMAFECIYTYKNVTSMLEVLTLFFPLFSYMFKQIFFLLYENDFLILYEFLKDETLNSIPRRLHSQMAEPLKLAKGIGIGYQISCACTVSLFTVLPVFTDKMLPVQVTFVDLGNVYNTAMYFLQACGIVNAAANNSCLDFIAVGLMCIIKGQVCVLNEKLNSFGEVIEDENLESNPRAVSYISECVNHHNKIIMLVSLVEKVFSMLVLVQYAASILIICNIGFQLVIVDIFSFPFLLMMSFFIAMMCQLGMYCWFGNEIIINSLAIRDACYESNWMNSNSQIRKMLLIIMIRSKKPLYLTAGKFSILSLASFTSVINSAYSFFALMQRMYRRSEDLKM